MKSNELTTEIITHKLKIKGEGTKYITKKFAKVLFDQLSDDNKSVKIVNPQTYTHITRYKSEVDLIPLDKENKDFEDIIYLAGLTDSQKDKVRELCENRKKEKKSLTPGNLKMIINSVKNGG